MDHGVGLGNGRNFGTAGLSSALTLALLLSACGTPDENSGGEEASEENQAEAEGQAPEDEQPSEPEVFDVDSILHFHFNETDEVAPVGLYIFDAETGEEYERFGPRGVYEVPQVVDISPDWTWFINRDGSRERLLSVFQIIEPEDEDGAQIVPAASDDSVGAPGTESIDLELIVGDRHAEVLTYSLPSGLSTGSSIDAGDDAASEEGYREGSPHPPQCTDCDMRVVPEGPAVLASPTEQGIAYVVMLSESGTTGTYYLLSVDMRTGDGEVIDEQGGPIGPVEIGEPPEVPVYLGESEEGYLETETRVPETIATSIEGEVSEDYVWCDHPYSLTLENDGARLVPCEESVEEVSLSDYGLEFSDGDFQRLTDGMKYEVDVDSDQESGYTDVRLYRVEQDGTEQRVENTPPIGTPELLLPYVGIDR